MARKKKHRDGHVNRYQADSDRAQAECKKTWACSRKQRYLTEQEAWTHIPFGKETMLIAYGCQHCNGWHLAKSVDERARRLNASLQNGRKYYELMHRMKRNKN